MKERILLVEDDPEMAQLINKQINEVGYNLELAADGESGLAEAIANDYAMVILDINLPKLNGLEICKRLRSEKSDIPIILLTSRADEVDKVLGLEFGADDYITKPFSSRELVARIHAILRRAKTFSTRNAPSNSLTSIDSKLCFGPLEINLIGHAVTYEGRRLELTRTEYDLLLFLASNPGKLFTRDDLMTNVWGYQASNFHATVTMYLSRIRTKIEPDPEYPRFLHTHRGSGYCFEDRGTPIK